MTTDNPYTDDAGRPENMIATVTEEAEADDGDWVRELEPHQRLNMARQRLAMTVGGSSARGTLLGAFTWSGTDPDRIRSAATAARIHADEVLRWAEDVAPCPEVREATREALSAQEAAVAAEIAADALQRMTDALPQSVDPQA